MGSHHKGISEPIVAGRRPAGMPVQAYQLKGKGERNICCQYTMFGISPWGPVSMGSKVSKDGQNGSLIKHSVLEPEPDQRSCSYEKVH